MEISKCVSKVISFGSKIIIAVSLVLFVAVGQANAASEAVQKAGVQYACALLDMMAYKSQLNEVIRDVISDFGYEIVNYKHEDEKAATNFILLRSKEPGELTGKFLNIVAVPGTEKMKDVEVDLRFQKVLFGGSVPSEFEQYAKTEKTTSAQPLVHKGFNDYTQTAFFTPKEDGSLGVDPLMEIIYKDNEDLLLTGHSLGGAVAVLLGSRMECMGIPPGSIQVVTFGAPAVGNKTFAKEYGDVVKHTRYTMSGDPVHGLLQFIKAGYEQTGEEVKCKRNPNSLKFSHNMSEYLDSSIRNFLDTLEAENVDLHNHAAVNDTAKVFSLPGKPVKGRAYLAPAVVNIPDDIDNDAVYMKQLTELIEGYEFDESVDGEETDERAQNAAAIRTSCDRICRVSIGAKQLTRKVYQITVQEDISDPYGNIISTQTCGTTTDNLSPIEAVLYSLGRCTMNRENFE
ncbi:lipase family protein [Anaerovibrio lipolyticus]|uniref:lipase family protein n=1 Tax=Anaerovibrio lipolyticus TaxID=82374 RepID=UPI00047FA4EB|nr:lipase family protein [Anaerovibrio lipolyticus]